MLASDEASLRALRDFLARILGWSAERAQDIERAHRAIHLALTHCAALVLLGDVDLVSIAHGLHRRTLGPGPDRPFIVCDPRRTMPRASVRGPESHGSGLSALRAAAGGSLCLRRRRPPRDLRSLVTLLRGPDAPVQLIVCADARLALDPFLLRPAPIVVPPLSARAGELAQIVEAFADDAIRDLSAGETGFSHVDRDWVIRHSAATLPEIEKGTRRLVALRQTGSILQAAERLGMSAVSLGQWFRYRRPPARRGRR